jgi:hypothetical protein
MTQQVATISLYPIRCPADSHEDATMTLQPSTIEKLSKLFPRLASDHDGEVVATARAIVRTLQAAGSSLHDLSAAMTPKTVQKIVYRERTVARDRPAAPEARHQPEYIAMPREKTIRLAKILLAENHLKERQEKFVQHMLKAAALAKNKFPVTVKQWKRWQSILVENDIFEEEV